MFFEQQILRRVFEVSTVLRKQMYEKYIEVTTLRTINCIKRLFEIEPNV